MSRNWQEKYREAAGVLTAAGVAEAELDAWYLLEFVTGMSRTEYLMHREEPFLVLQGQPEQSGRTGQPGQPERWVGQQAQIARFDGLVAERAKRIPLSYLTGWRNFCGLEFAVNDAVLIPRQDTECLVEELLPYTKGARILDMCTGSGCIAVSLAVLGQPLSVTGADISERALAVAESNGERLLAEKAVKQKQMDALPELRWQKSDLFEQVDGEYDIIVSNPPYIQSSVIDTLEPEVRDHEPRLALDGREDGLYFYRRLVKEAPEYLVKGGILAFEIGYDQGEAVSELMREQGLEQVRVIRDLAGMDRIVTGRNGEKQNYV